MFHPFLERELKFDIPLFHVNNNTNCAKKRTSQNNWTRGLTLNVHNCEINGNIIWIDDVLIIVNENYVPVDFTIMDIECEPSCPIILGRPFLRTAGAIIDMKEGTIKFQFPLKKGMEHFPRKKIKLPIESVTRASYSLERT